MPKKKKKTFSEIYAQAIQDELFFSIKFGRFSATVWKYRQDETNQSDERLNTFSIGLDIGLCYKTDAHFFSLPSLYVAIISRPNWSDQYFWHSEETQMNHFVDESIKPFSISQNQKGYEW